MQALTPQLTEACKAFTLGSNVHEAAQGELGLALHLAVALFGRILPSLASSARRRPRCPVLVPRALAAWYESFSRSLPAHCSTSCPTLACTASYTTDPTTGVEHSLVQESNLLMVAILGATAPSSPSREQRNSARGKTRALAREGGGTCE